MKRCMAVFGLLLGLGSLTQAAGLTGESGAGSELALCSIAREGRGVAAELELGNWEHISLLGHSDHPSKSQPLAENLNKAFNKASERAWDVFLDKVIANSKLMRGLAVAILVLGVILQLCGVEGAIFSAVGIVILGGVFRIAIVLLVLPGPW